ncbi:hypothetical protein [Streptomyces sp. NPDC053048]
MIRFLATPPRWTDAPAPSPRPALRVRVRIRTALTAARRARP